MDPSMIHQGGTLDVTDVTKSPLGCLLRAPWVAGQPSCSELSERTEWRNPARKHHKARHQRHTRVQQRVRNYPLFCPSLDLHHFEQSRWDRHPCYFKIYTVHYRAARYQLNDTQKMIGMENFWSNCFLATATRYNYQRVKYRERNKTHVKEAHFFKGSCFSSVRRIVSTIFLNDF